MPPSPSPHSKASSDDNTSRLSEAALRKKKNADAQAAFRARRANYIATLEETVTNLESVVIQLQDSCREAKAEIAKLRQENARHRQEAKERDRMLRSLWQERSATRLSSQSHDFSPAPSYATHQPSSMVASPMGSAHVVQYADNGMRYSTANDQPVSLGGAFHHAGIGQDFSQRSPTLTFANNVGADTSPDVRSHQMDTQRMTRYGQYSYSMDSTQDGAWVQADGQTGPSPNDILDSSSSSHSPNYLESPTLTSSELAYPTQFSLEDQKAPLGSLDSSSSYMFHSSRSISPALSTPTSTSSTSLGPAPYQFTFQESSIVQDRPDFGYRRQHAPQLTLHGGTADISVLAANRDPSRYKVAPRTNPFTDRPIAQALASYSRRENGSAGRESDDSESASYTYSSRSRRSEATSTHASRSPSPIPPAICGTLAVIKAQAFGALRRTRTRSRKTSEGAAKAAVEALEARGIGMGLTVGTKRQRLHLDDDDDDDGKT